MKAYSVNNYEIPAYDGNGAIIYAQSKTEALRKFVKKYPYWCDVDEPENTEVLHAQRQPTMDQYQGKKIPDLAYAKIGWYSHCDSCGEGHGCDGFSIFKDKVICHRCFEEEPAHINKEVGE